MCITEQAWKPGKCNCSQMEQKGYNGMEEEWNKKGYHSIEKECAKVIIIMPQCFNDKKIKRIY